MEIPAELSKIIINETEDSQIIVLKETGGDRSFPIVIGIVEICAIDRRLKGIAPPRPMTHDLLGQAVEKLGGKIEKVVITDLRNHTYYAEIHINQNGTMHKIDSRPSDAIALGVATNAPIFIEDHVFGQASM